VATESCPYCDGIGRVEIVIPTPPSPIEEECHICKGFGWIEIIESVLVEDK